MQLAAAAELKAIDEQKKADVARFVDALFADLVVVPAGKFRMGDVSGKGELMSARCATSASPRFASAGTR